MIWLIAKKDFLLNLLSVRFIIGFVICLVIIPFTMIVSIEEYKNQLRIYQIDQKKAEQELKEVQVYSQLRPTVVKKPEVLNIFSKGITNNIGTSTKVSFQEYPIFPSGHASSRDNPLLYAFFSTDFATVIAIVISLLALVFAYDSVTREREGGTMKLMFTNQVSRITFLLGKLTGLILTLLPILLFCYLLACLMLVITPSIHLNTSDWVGIGLLFLTSITYMLVFILLGMCISSLTTHSSSSIISCLLCWIIFLFLIPSMATYLSQSITPTPLFDNVRAAVMNYHKEYEKQYWEIIGRNVKETKVRSFGYWAHNDGPDGMVIMNGGRLEMVKALQQTTLWSEPYRIGMADKIWSIQKEYLDKLITQQHLQRNLSWLSPSELFKQATDALCRTDADAFLKYMETQRDYRESVIRYFKDHSLFASIHYFTTQPEGDFPSDKELKDDISHTEPGGGGYPANWNPSLYPTVNTSDVPHYVYRMSSSTETFQTALGRLAALLGLSGCLLLGTAVLFMRYDVR